MLDSETRYRVIFDHDGGVDDLLSLMLLLTMEHVDVLAVTITPADCYLSDATTATQKLLALFGRSDIPIGQGSLTGKNPFPADWRAQPKMCNAMPLMLNQAHDHIVIDEKPAHALIAALLLEHQDVTVLMTGPCTNLTTAIAENARIQANILQVIWMGGAVDVQGNVAMHNHNTTAEWNAYWDPAATRALIESGVNVKLIALDACNSLPVDIDFLKVMAKQSHYQVSDLASQFWATTINTIPSYEFTYYMWDVLATSLLGDVEDAWQFERAELAVSVEEPNEGQTFRKPGTGNEIDVAMRINRDKIISYVLQQFARNF